MNFLIEQDQLNKIMKKINKGILVRYDELTLKGQNRREFIKFQITYIRKKLEENKIDYNYVDSRNKLFFTFKKKNHLAKAYDLFDYIIGLSKISIVTKVETIDELNKIALKIIKDDNPINFKVEVKRREETKISTDELKRNIATHILKNSEYKVEIKKPSYLINVELFAKYYLIAEKTKSGRKGLPPGINGRALVLLSGGIDSPVAAYKMMSRGLHVDYLSFTMPPNTTKKATDKIKKLRDQLAKFQPNTKLFFVNITPYTNEIRHAYTDRYNIILLRRAFIKIATEFANNNHYQAIITGDSLGQVASQTMEAQNVIKESLSNIQLLQPLIGDNKFKIIEIAKDIGTYEISILKGEDTCSMFVPKSPVTKPKLEVAKKIEESNELLDMLIIKISKEIKNEIK